eukprot:gnl/Chilomastix_cuspidata/3139.p1 GENE.gnl/Chilomastix_cuspidata/3139~~gnl/Chilomastix_cuspidata/3139.p1  ORF type:complete len:279 (+),score=79.08 gnl/Chilomastix_cuspidata/3139:49-885(+)
MGEARDAARDPCDHCGRAGTFSCPHCFAFLCGQACYQEHNNGACWKLLKTSRCSPLQNAQGAAASSRPSAEETSLPARLGFRSGADGVRATEPYQALAQRLVSAVAKASAAHVLATAVELVVAGAAVSRLLAVNERAASVLAACALLELAPALLHTPEPSVESAAGGAIERVHSSRFFRELRARTEAGPERLLRDLASALESRDTLFVALWALRGIFVVAAAALSSAGEAAARDCTRALRKVEFLTVWADAGDIPPSALFDAQVRALALAAAHRDAAP